MTKTVYLPDAMTVEIGSPAQEDLRLALAILEGWFKGDFDLPVEYEEGNFAGIGRAIDTLRALTRDAI